MKLSHYNRRKILVAIIIGLFILSSVPDLDPFFPQKNTTDSQSQPLAGSQEQNRRNLNNQPPSEPQTGLEMDDTTPPSLSLDVDGDVTFEHGERSSVIRTWTASDNFLDDVYVYARNEISGVKEVRASELDVSVTSVDITIDVKELSFDPDNFIAGTPDYTEYTVYGYADDDSDNIVNGSTDAALNFKVYVERPVAPTVNAVEEFVQTEDGDGYSFQWEATAGDGKTADYVTIEHAGAPDEHVDHQHEYFFENSLTDNIGSADGSLIGDPTYVTGNNGTSLSFDGTGDGVNFGNLNFISSGASGEYTVSLWVKFDTVSVRQHVFGDEQVGNNGILMELSSAGQMRTYVSGAYATHPRIMSTDYWYHIIMWQNSGGIWLSINGDVHKFSSNTHSETTYNTFLGLFQGLSRDFSGDIDDLKIYSSDVGNGYTFSHEPADLNAWTSGGVESDYNVGTTGYHYWDAKFYDNTGLMGQDPITSIYDPSIDPVVNEISTLNKYEEGDSSQHLLEWQIIEDYPTVYTIRRSHDSNFDGIFETTNNIVRSNTAYTNGEIVNIDVGGLTQGIWQYRVSAQDVAGNIVYYYTTFTVEPSDADFSIVSNGFTSKEYEAENRSDMISYYSLEGDVTDSYGSNDGTNNGVAFEDGIINKAGDFERSNGDYIDLTSSGIDVSNFQNGYSISMWFKLDDLDSNQILINFHSNFQNGQSLGVRIVTNGDIRQFWYMNDLDATGGLISPDTYYHLVLTWDGATRKIYLDGVEVATDTPTNNLDLSVLNSATIGTGLSSEDVNGLIDDVRIYSSAINPIHISNLYEMGLGYIDPSFNLVHYQFEQNALDSSTYNNDAYVDPNTLQSQYQFNNDLLDSKGNYDASYGSTSIDLQYQFNNDALSEYNLYDRPYEPVLDAKYSFNNEATDSSVNSYPTTHYTLGFMGHYKMNGDVTDGTTKNYDGVNNGVTFGSGKINQAGIFDGSSDYVDLSSSFDFSTIESSFTVSMWIKPDTLGATFFSARTAHSQNNALHLRVATDGSLRFGYYSNDLDTTTGLIVAGNWYHVVFTDDGTNREIYINDNSYATDANGGTLDLNANPSTAIGAWVAASSYFDGQIDDVRIYSHGLTDFDQDDIYNSGSGTEEEELFNQYYTNFGVIDGALDLESEYREYVEVDTTALNYEYTDSFTFTGWVNQFTPTDGFRVLVSNTEATTLRGYYIALEDRELRIRLFNDNTASNGIKISGPDIGFSTMHLVVTYDGSGLASGFNAYYDGVQQSLTTVQDTLSGTTVSSNKFTIGRRAGENDLYFSGRLDDLRMYSTELDSSAISDLYNSGVGTEGYIYGQDLIFSDYQYSTENAGFLLDNDLTDTQGTYTLSKSSNAEYVSAYINQGVRTTETASTLEYMQMSDDSTLNVFDESFDLTYTLWHKPLGSSPDLRGTIISKPWNDGGEYNYRFEIEADSNMQLILEGAGTPISAVSTSQPVNFDEWNHFALVFDVSEQEARGYVNGKLVVTLDFSSITWTPDNPDQNRPLAIGTLYPYGLEWGTSYDGHMASGDYDEIRIYKDDLDKTEIALLAQNKPAQSIGYDTGKINQAVKFNSSEGDALFTYTYPFETALQGSISISNWFKHETGSPVPYEKIYAITDDRQVGEWSIIFQADSTGSNWEYHLEREDGTVTKFTYSLPTSTNWVHSVLTIEGTTAKWYVNSVLQETMDMGGAIAYTGMNYFDVGWNPTTNDRYYDGLMDDIRFFKSVVSQNEVDDLYNSGSGSEAVVEKIDFVNAVTNQGADFEADDDDSVNLNHIYHNYDSDDSFSISTWIKPESLTNGAILSNLDTDSNSIGYELLLHSTGVIRFQLINNYGATNRIIVDSTTVLSTGVMYHVVTTYDGSSSASGVKIYLNSTLDTPNVISDSLTGSIFSTDNLRIGQRTDGTFGYDGIIDELRIYSSSLSAENVGFLYNSGAGNEDYVQTIEYTTGQLGYAGSFDGNYVDRFNVTNNGEFVLGDGTISISLWFKSSGLIDTNGKLVTTRDGTTERWSLRVESTGEILLSAYDGTNSGSLTTTGQYLDGQWHHVVAVFSKSNLKIVVDNTEVVENSIFLDTVDSTGNLGIGHNIEDPTIGYNFHGLLDNIQIYNTTLTDDQIDLQYKQNTNADGKYISFTAFDEFPNVYDLEYRIDGTGGWILLRDNVPWTSGEKIPYNIRNLYVNDGNGATYEFRITYYDQTCDDPVSTGSTDTTCNFDQMIHTITVKDSDPTSTTSPSDIFYEESDPNSYSITWTPSSEYEENFYTITKNGVYESGLSFDDKTPYTNDVDITHDVSGLSAGVYDFKITYYDVVGHTASDTVQVTVDTNNPPTVSSPANILYEATNNDSVIHYSFDNTVNDTSGNGNHGDGGNQNLVPLDKIQDESYYQNWRYLSWGAPTGDTDPFGGTTFRVWSATPATPARIGNIVGNELGYIKGNGEPMTFSWYLKAGAVAPTNVRMDIGVQCSSGDLSASITSSWQRFSVSCSLTHDNYFFFDLIHDSGDLLFSAPMVNRGLTAQPFTVSPTWDQSDETAYFYKAGRFSGYGSVDTGHVLDSENSFSISTWIKHSMSSDSSGFIAGNNGYAPRNIEFGPYSLGGFRAAMWTGTTWIDTGVDEDPAYRYDDNQWHHVVYTVDYQTNLMSLYVDNTLIGSNTFEGKHFPNIAETLHVGGNPTGGYFNGYLDEFYLFDHAISEERIAQLYASGGANPISWTLNDNGDPNEYEIRSGSTSVCDEEVIESGTWSEGQTFTIYGDGHYANRFYCITATDTTNVATGSDEVQINVNSGTAPMINNPADINHSPTNTEDGLIAYYKFDGDLTDEQGVADATVNYGSITYEEGVDGKSVRVDDDGIKATIGSYFLDRESKNGSFAISLWVRSATGSHSGDMVVGRQGYHAGIRSFAANYQMSTYDTANTFNTAGTTTITSSEYQDWNHIVGMYENGYISIYKNGVFQTGTQMSLNLRDYNSDLWIGGNGGLGSSYNFDGWIDELRLYSTALSYHQIKELANRENRFNSYRFNFDQTLDTTDNQYTGTPSDAGTIAYTDGVFGQSLDLTNNNSIDYGSNFQFGTTSFSISVWFKTTGTTLQTIAGTKPYNNGNTAGYSLFVDDTNLYFTFGDNIIPLATITSTSTVNDGIWHHAFISVDRSDGNAKMYVDSSLEGEIDISSFSDIAGSSFTIGSRALDTLNEFYGQLDELMIIPDYEKDELVTGLYEKGQQTVQWAGSGEDTSGMYEIFHQPDLTADRKRIESGTWTSQFIRDYVGSEDGYYTVKLYDDRGHYSEDTLLMNTTDRNAYVSTNSLENDLLLYLPFDNNANDYSSYSRSTSVVGSPTYQEDEAIHGYSAYFDGTNDWIEGIPWDVTADEMTFSWWQKWEDAGDQDHPVMSNNPTSAWESDNGFSLGSGWNDDQRHAVGDISFFMDGHTEYAGTEWVHQTITYKRGEPLRYFLDGELIYTTTATADSFLTNTGQDLRIADAPVRTGHFKGYLDDIRIYNRQFDTSEVSALYTYDPLQVEIDTSDQTFYTSFDNGSFDDSQGGLTGTGGTLQDGLVDGSAYFDGSTGTDINYGDYDHPLSDITVSLWLNLEDYGGAQTIVHKESSFSIRIGTNGEFWWADGTDFSYSNFGAQDIGWTFDEWHHLVVSKEGGDVYVWLDGTLAVVRTNFGGSGGSFSLVPPNNFNLFIGSYNGGSNYAKGNIDEVRIFDKRLNERMIDTLYNVGARTSEFSHYYSLDNPLDLSGNSNHLDVVGASYGDAYDGMEFIGSDYAYTDYSLGYEQSLTFSTWVKTSVYGQFATVGAGVPGSNHNSLNLKMYSDRVDFTIYNGNIGATTVTYTGTFELNTWYHVVGTWNGDEMTVFVDGQQGETQPRSEGLSITSTLLLGSSTWGNVWDGSLKDFRVYDFALTQDDISAIHNDKEQYEIFHGYSDIGGTYNVTNIEIQSSVNGGAFTDIYDFGYNNRTDWSHSTAYILKNNHLSAGSYTYRIIFYDDYGFNTTLNQSFVVHARTDFMGFLTYGVGTPMEVNFDYEEGNTDSVIPSKIRIGSYHNSYIYIRYQVDGGEWQYESNYDHDEHAVSDYLFWNNIDLGGKTAGTYTYVWTTVDEFGYEMSQTKTFTVHPSVNPYVNSPDDIKLYRDQTGLIHHYDFDGQVEDNIGTLDGTPSGTEYVEGLHGKSLKLDGTNPDSVSFDTVNWGTEFSVGIWVKTDSASLPNYAKIFQTDDGVVGNWAIVLQADATGSNIEVHVEDENSNVQKLDLGAIRANEWVYYEITVGSQNAKGYVDGLFTDSVALSNPIRQPTELYLGYSPRGTQLFDGEIDMFSVYNYERSSLKISQSYNKIADIQPSFDYLRDYRLDNNIQDDSEYRNDASISQGVYVSGYDNQGIDLDLGETLTFPEFVLDRGMSLSFWVNIDSETENIGLFRGPDTPYDQVITWYTPSDALRIQDNQGDEYYFYNLDPTSYLNQWLMITIVFGDAGSDLYFNATHIANYNALSFPLTLSEFGEGYGTANFDGTVDNIRVIKKSLSQNEVAYLANDRVEEQISLSFDNGLNSDDGSITLSNSGATIDPTGGKSGQGAYFDGSSYVSIPWDDKIITGNVSEMSTSFWVNYDDLYPDDGQYKRMGLIGDWNWDVGDQMGWHISLEHSTIHTFHLNVVLGDGVDYSTVFTMPWQPDLNEWYHMAFTYNHGSYQFFINNQIVAEGKTIEKFVANDGISTAIGKSYINQEYHRGWIDQIKISNKAMTAADVRDNYYSTYSSLVAYYDFEHNVDDQTDGSHAGQLMGDPQYVQGVDGYGLDLDGVNDWVDITSYSDVTTSSATLMFWIKYPQQTGNYRRIINSPTGDSWNIYYTNDGVALEGGYGSGFWGSIGDQSGASTMAWALGNNIWSHYAVTIDYGRGSMLFYMNGELERTITDLRGFTEMTISDLDIGYASDQSNYYGNFTIDEMKIFDGSLTQQQIRDEYANNLITWRLRDSFAGQDYTIYRSDTSGCTDTVEFMSGDWQINTTYIQVNPAAFERDTYLCLVVTDEAENSYTDEVFVDVIDSSTTPAFGYQTENQSFYGVSHEVSELGLDKNMAAHYPLDGNANDAVGTLDGQIYGDTEYVSGKMGQGFQTKEDSVLDYLDIPYDNKIVYDGGKFAMSMWYYLPVMDYGYLFVKPWNGNGEYNYEISVASGVWRMAVGGATSVSYTTNTAPNIGEWTHMLMYMNGTHLQLYQNYKVVGVLDYTSISSWTPSNGDGSRSLAIGTLYPYEVSNEFEGQSLDAIYDDVRIYNDVAFDHRQAFALYQMGNSHVDLSVDIPTTYDLYTSTDNSTWGLYERGNALYSSSTLNTFDASSITGDYYLKYDYVDEYGNSYTQYTTIAEVPSIIYKELFIDEHLDSSGNIVTDEKSGVLFYPKSSYSSGSYEIYRDGQLLKSGTWSNGNNIWFDDINSNGTLADGQYELTYRLYRTGGYYNEFSINIDYVDSNPFLYIAPSDKTIGYDTYGNYLKWAATDPHGGNAELYRDGTLVDQQEWSSADYISFNIDGLAPGTYNYEVKIYDLSGNVVSDTVSVTVLYDNDSPVLVESPDDIVGFAEGSGDLSWEVSDLTKGTYEIFVDTISNTTGSWSDGSTIVFDVSGFAVGEYNITIVVTDNSGNAITDEVTIVVDTIDNTAPSQVISPADYIYDVGTTGHVLKWAYVDNYADYYVIMVDGVQVAAGSWDSSDYISYNIDGLAVGSYSVQITVYDASGNSATDTVQVTVQ